MTSWHRVRTRDALRTNVAKDIAINLAVGQIREATTRENTSWISQPGAIRLFGRENRTGRARSIYKLYTSHSMTASSVEQLALDIPQDWDHQSARFFDLNRPIIEPDPSNPKSADQAILHFPICRSPRLHQQGRSGIYRRVQLRCLGDQRN